MSLRVGLGVVGAAIGGFIGGPQGAQIGWALGSVAGNIVDPKTIRGPSIGDISQQTSQEGGPRPIVYGLSQPIYGNVIATSQPSVVSTRSSGKGGPKVVTEAVYRTYAIGVCETVGGFVRVWRNNKLVYDASDDPIVEPEDNIAFLEKARFFLGTFDQDPSPDLEVIFGVGTTPAHRGTAYMVMADEDLTDMGGAIPQWQFQVYAGGGLAPVYGEPGVIRTLYAGADFNAGAGEIAAFGGAGATYATPVGVNFVRVLLVGRGGTGNNVGGSANGSAGGGGGGGEVLDISKVPVSGSVTVYVGSTANPLDTGDKVAITSFGSLFARGGGLTSGADTSTLGKVNEAGQGYKYSGLDSPTYTKILPNAVVGGFTGGTATSLHTGGVKAYAAAGGGAGSSASGVNGVYTVTGGNGGAGTNCSAFGTDIGESGTFGGGGGGSISPDAITDFASTRGSGGLGGGGRGSVASQASITWGSTSTTASWNGKPKSGGGGGGGNVGGTTYGVGGTGYCVVLHYDPAYWGAGYWPDGVGLSALIEAICARAGVSAADIDTSLLPDTQVRGLVVINQYDAAEAIRSLGQVYLFDVATYDAKVRFIPRGENSVATITEDDMVDDGSSIEKLQRSDPLVIPRVLNLNYYDAVYGGLNSAKQTSDRSGDRRAVADASIQSPVIMVTDLAAKTVDIQHKVMVEETKGEIKLSLPDSFLFLTPSDPIIVQSQGSSERFRITQADTQDGYQEYTCARDRQSAYTSTVEGIPPPPPTAPPSSIPGPTLLVVIDSHILQDADDNVGLGYYVAVAGLTAAWGGALVELSYDGGANYTSSQSATDASIMGQLVTVLADHPYEYPDVVNGCTVEIQTYGAELSDTTLAGMMNRVNLALIGDEIINFAEVDEISAEGQWDLSYFLRGRKGTEPVSHSIGANFTMLDRSILAFIPASISDIGKTLTFRATSFGTTSDTGTVVAIVYEGRSQIERAPAYLSVRRDGTDLIASWQGVGRIGGGATVAQGLRFTGYRISFDDGSSSGPIVVDTVDQFITQSVSGLSSPITVSVVQLNSLTGEGPSIEVIVI